ncbi:MAG: RNA pseudouridine synthase [Tenericutes bacterium HGW-Tenericutes-5]|nr:MAG: RNA pseudouridine synthase [Tenericutes bacterium HGW-Tenericutes-5]
MNDLNVIYEDNHIIVVEKPAGVLSQAGSLDLPDLLTIIKNYIKVKYQKPGNVFLGLVHRLDTNVGGVMVYAKTSKAASRLSKEIRTHNFNKNYLAIVEGNIDVGKTETLTDYLAKDEETKTAYFTDDLDGKISTLTYKSLANKSVDNNNYTLLKIELETGRFHQIRAQLSKHLFPIINDSKYGKKQIDFNLGLFAYNINFKHPTLDKAMNFTIVPKDYPFNMFQTELDLLEENL